MSGVEGFATKIANCSPWQKASIPGICLAIKGATKSSPKSRPCGALGRRAKNTKTRRCHSMRRRRYQASDRPALHGSTWVRKRRRQGPDRSAASGQPSHARCALRPADRGPAVNQYSLSAQLSVHLRCGLLAATPVHALFSAAGTSVAPSLLHCHAFVQLTLCSCYIAPARFAIHTCVHWINDHNGCIELLTNEQLHEFCPNARGFDIFAT